MRSLWLLVAGSLLLFFGCGDILPPGQFPVLYRHDFELAGGHVRTEPGHPHQGFQQVWVNEEGKPVAHRGAAEYPPGTVWLLKVSEIAGSELRLAPGKVLRYFVMTRLDPDDEDTYPAETDGWVYEVYPVPAGDPAEVGVVPARLGDPVTSCHDCHRRAESRGYVYSMFKL